jgi:hypothetical protein
VALHFLKSRVLWPARRFFESSFSLNRPRRRVAWLHLHSSCGLLCRFAIAAYRHSDRTECAQCRAELAAEEGVCTSSGRMCDACSKPRRQADAARSREARSHYEAQFGTVCAVIAATGIAAVSIGLTQLNSIPPPRVIAMMLMGATYTVVHAIRVVHRYRNTQGVAGVPASLYVSTCAAAVSILGIGLLVIVLVGRTE